MMFNFRLLRVLFGVILMGMSFHTINAQHVITEYWRLTKTYYKHGMVKVNKVNSGQFIARNSKICYDSDNQGYSINNGSLKVIRHQENVVKYSGACYYGDGCTYTFYLRDSILNIEDLDGNIYVYHCEKAPSERKTSSLIRRKNYEIYTGGTNVDESSSGNSGTDTKSNAKKTQHPKTCRKCLGKCICTTCNGTGTVYSITYGNNHYITCPSCNGSRKCSLCGGKGTFGYDYY